jgi:vancomycin resistance protein YoaR
MNEGSLVRLIGVICVLSGVAFSLFWSISGSAEYYAIEDQHMRIDSALHDLKSVRVMRERGIPVKATFIDGTSRGVQLAERSQALTPEESVQFYRLPTDAEIFAHWGVSGFSSIGSQASDRLMYAAIFDKRAIEKYFTEYFDDELHEATNARYRIENGEVAISDDAPGQQLNMEEFYKELSNSLAMLSRDPIELHGEESAARVTRSELQKSREVMQGLVNGRGISISFHGRTWPVRGSDLLSIVMPQGEGKFTVDEKALERFAESVGHSLVTNPVIEPRFGIKDGVIVQLAPGKDGEDFSFEELAVSVGSWLVGARGDPDPVFKLSTKTTGTSLSIEQLKKLGITSRIGMARTSFKGSSKDRIHNIKLGSSRVTSKLVMPGEEYSLVKAIGYAEKENGYREEYVIKGDRSKKEAGGGLCQLATTFFRSIIDAGLPVTERHNHKYVVGYYGPGLDATIYDVSVDLKFRNDTSAPILVQAYTEGNDLVVELFGKPDGRAVVTTKPLISNHVSAPPTRYLFTAELPTGEVKCVEKARDGMTTDAQTRVRYADGKTKYQNWHSEYTPWAQVCMVGAPWGTEELPD